MVVDVDDVVGAGDVVAVGVVVVVAELVVVLFAGGGVGPLRTMRLADRGGESPGATNGRGGER